MTSRPSPARRAAQVLIALAAVLIAAPYVYGPIYRFPEPAPFSGSHFWNPYANRPAVWQRANFHAHGRAWVGVTNGQQSDEEVAQRYRDLGYSVPGVSDYQRIAAQHGVATIPAYEHGYNIIKQHQVAIGARHVVWFDFPLWQSLSHQQYVIDRVKQEADVIALAHPATRDAYTTDDLQHLSGYDLIEIVNGPFAVPDIWDAALSSGHAVWAVANDDTHDLLNPKRTAAGWNMVGAPTAGTADIVDALRAGRTYAVLRTGAIDAANLTVVDRVDLDRRALSVAVTGAASTFSFVGQNGAIRKTVKDALTAEYTLTDADTYIRTVIETPQTVLYLNPVLRYDGQRLPAPLASVDLAATWTWRGSIALGLGGLALAYARRRRPGLRPAAQPVLARRQAEYGVKQLARAIPLLAVLFLSASPLSAQPAPAPRVDAEPLVSSYDPGFLRDLPTNNSLFTIIDTLQPSIVSDRIAGGGLFVGQPARIGGFLSSWTQTVFRLDGVPFTDPTGNGAPFLVPELLPWGNVRIGTGAFSADTGAGGLAIDLKTASPTDRWRGTIEGAFAHGRLLSTGAAQPARPIGYVDGADRGSIVAAGPVVKDRVSATVAVSAARGAQVSPADQFAVDSSVQSAFAHLIFTPNAIDTVRVLGLAQRRRQPLDQRFVLRRPLSTLQARGGHGQLAWEHRPADAAAIRVSVSASQRSDTPDYGSLTSGIADRLLDGPTARVSTLSHRNVRAWSASARVEPRSGGVHRVFAGADIDGGQLESSSFFTGAIGELVHGVPARVWQFNSPGTPSKRRVTTLAGYAGDRLTLSKRLTIEAGVRAELVKGSAEGADQGVLWRSLLPHASARIALTDSGHTALFASYSRSGSRLSLDDLAVGDPAAPHADVYRWTALAGFPLSLADRGARVARVGPGTGGDPNFAAIDPNLRRPVSDELVIGIEGQPLRGVLLRVAGVTRQERNLSGLVNTGAPIETSYTSFPVADPGGDVLDPEDDQTLTVYNRIPASFAKDRYLWTSPAYSGSTFSGLELTIQFQTDRVTFTAGGTAGIAETFAAAAGYGPLENDQTVLGELFTNANSSTLAHGRPFTDRAFTGKIAMVYRLPSEVRLGLVARYQDGQPFSRLLVFPGLNQGADPVRAFPNGDSRFMFVGTLDGRVQKRIAAGERSVDVFLDAYNLLNMHNSVEEDVAGLPDVRTAIANQPPRSVHAGVRVTF